MKIIFVWILKKQLYYCWNSLEKQSDAHKILDFSDNFYIRLIRINLPLFVNEKKTWKKIVHSSISILFYQRSIDLSIYTHNIF